MEHAIKLLEKERELIVEDLKEQLPFIEGRGGFSCYRIAIDNESDDIKFWDEYEKSDGSKLSLYPRDYIINRKY